MSEDYSTASERAQIFEAAKIKWAKLADWFTATSARLHETAEAVESLPASEQRQYVAEVLNIKGMCIDRLGKYFGACRELLQAARQAPEWATRDFDEKLILASVERLEPAVEQLRANVEQMKVNYLNSRRAA